MSASFLCKTKNIVLHYMATISKNIITKVDNRQAFLKLLEHNPGIIVVKFGADWCAPCKTIQPLVDNFFIQSPDNVMCAELNIDESFDVFSFLKFKKMVSGVPTILCYAKNNVSFVPDDSVSGADPVQIQQFFKCCVRLLNNLGDA